MDIIITGGQAAGKTTAAHKMLSEKFGVANLYKAPVAQLLMVQFVPTMRVDVIRAMIVASRTEAVYFDGCIVNAFELLVMLQAVKEAREQTGRDFYAVYVVLTDSPLKIDEHPNNVDIKNYVL